MTTSRNLSILAEGVNSSGVLQVSNGGTGLASITSNQIPYGNGTGNLLTSSVFTFDGTTLSSTKFAGALNGSVGATTPSTGAFTTLSTTDISTFGSYSNIKELLETLTVTAAAPSATTNFDVITQASQYYTTAATTNFTFNIRGNSTTSLNTMMATGQSATIALLVTNGATPYYPNVIQIDGVTVTPKWQLGAAPVSGNASSVDVYLFNIMKTASATYTVLASQTAFA